MSKYKKVKYGVYGCDDEGCENNYPDKIFNDFESAKKFAIENEGKIHYGVPIVREIRRKIIWEHGDKITIVK